MKRDHKCDLGTDRAGIKLRIVTRTEGAVFGTYSRSLGSFGGGPRGSAFVLFFLYVNALVVRLVLPTLGVTDSLGFPPRVVAYHWFPPGDCLSFPCGVYRG